MLLEFASSLITDCSIKESAEHILKRLEEGCSSSPTLRDIADLALTQDNLDLWIQVISLSVTKYENHIFLDYQINVKRACLAFGFRNVRSRCALLYLYSTFTDPRSQLSLDQMLSMSRPEQVVDFIRSVTPYFSERDAAEPYQWYEEQITAAVDTKTRWFGEDLEMATSIVFAYGVRCLFNM